MKKAIRIGITSICAIALIVGYYYYLSVRNAATSSNDVVQLSEVEYITSKDLTHDYPATPRAVVKLYNRIMTDLFAENYTEEEYEKMADQLRVLFDNDLLAVNPRTDHLRRLREEVTDYKNRKKVIVNSTVCDTNEVKYKTVKGSECAYVSSYYFTREASSYARMYEEFCLRKDANGKWKIITFRISEGAVDDYR